MATEQEDWAAAVQEVYGPGVTVVVASDPRELEDTEWPMRASELAAVVAWTRGRIDRAGFRRWLRSERWPEGDLDDLAPLLEHIFATDERAPRRG